MAERNARGGWDLTDDDVKEVMRASFGGGEAEPVSPVLFLGGVCGDTTWRQDIAIPMLEAAGVTYYNPQIPAGQWRDELIEAEAAAKELARHILVVITGETRASASIQEATEHALRGRRGLFLVIKDIPEGTIIEGVEIKDADLKDANRARAYLRSVIRRLRPDVPIYLSVRDAVRAIIDLETGQRMDKAHDAITNAVNLLKRGGTALNLTYEEMSAMAGAADILIAAFPEYFEIKR